MALIWIRAASLNIAAALFFIIPAWAEEKPPLRPVQDEDSIITISWENDTFSGADDNYTNGVRAAYLSPEQNIPELVSAFAGMVPMFAENGHKRWHLAVGQSMYTPKDITLKNPPANDRPYAGWLYGSIGVISDTGWRLDNLQLTLGVVGPASAAAQTQDFVHHLVKAPDPQGWDHQLKNEPGIVLTYERKWRALYEFSPFGLGVDFTPSIGGSVGNVFTNASVGAVVRVGYDLPADYGPPLIRPSLPGSDFFVPHNSFGWYAFAGVEGRVVARDIFLDGNTFTSGPSVDKEVLVGGLQGGLAIFVDNTRIAYTHILRSREFQTQGANEQFGAITVSRRF